MSPNKSSIDFSFPVLGWLPKLEPPLNIFGFVKISHWLQLAPGSDRASCFFHRARGGDHRRGSKSRIKLAHKLNRQNQRLPNAFKIFKIFPTNTFDPRRASLEEELPLSNHQHRCRFCHFTSKKDFLIESPLSFSSKFPLLGEGLAAAGACLRVSQDFRVKLRN